MDFKLNSAFIDKYEEFRFLRVNLQEETTKLVKYFQVLAKQSVTSKFNVKLIKVSKPRKCEGIAIKRGDLLKNSQENEAFA